jgi:site-specific recombinase XerD
MATDGQQTARRGRPTLQLTDVAPPKDAGHLPKLGDRVEYWIDPRTAKVLHAAGLNTISDLREMHRKRGPTWFNAVSGIGKTRGLLLNEWFAAAGLVVEANSLPITDVTVGCRPAGNDVLPALAMGADVFSVILPDGEATGANRRIGVNALGADDDITAIKRWLNAFEKAGKARTFEAYRREIDRYLVWCRWAGVRFSETSLKHAQQYQSFLGSIPVGFIGHERVQRTDPRWRPFRGALSVRSQNYALQVVAQCHEALQKGGYLHFNPFASLKRPVVGGRAMDTTRSLNHDDLQWAQQELDELHSLCEGGISGKSLHDAHEAAIARRTVLALSILLHTGMRLQELATTTLDALRPARVDGRDVGGLWSITVHGKGGRDRDVYLPDHLVQMAHVHHEDVAHLLKLIGGSTMDARLKALRTRPPLLCAITAPVGKKHSRAIDDEASMACDNLALSKVGVYKTLKTFFRNRTLPHIKRIRLEILRLESERKTGKPRWSQLKRDQATWERRAAMSTHWLRHTFALEVLRTSGSDKGLKVTQQLLGHQSITTTAEYLRQDESEKVSVVSKMSFWSP